MSRSQQGPGMRFAPGPHPSFPRKGRDAFSDSIGRKEKEGVSHFSPRGERLLTGHYYALCVRTMLA